MSRLPPRPSVPRNTPSYWKIGTPEALRAPPLEGARSAPVARASGWTLIVGLNAAGPLAASGARGVAAAQGGSSPRNEARVTTPLPPKGLEQAETGDLTPARVAGARPWAPWHGVPWWSITCTSPHGTPNSNEMNWVHSTEWQDALDALHQAPKESGIR